MSFKPTIVVLVLAVIGVATVVLLRWDQPEAPTSRGQMLLSARQLPVDAVTGITLQRRGEPALEFVRGADGWTQTRPFAHPMDPFSIRRLAAVAGEVEVVKRIAPGDLEGIDLGLEPPRAVIAYEWPDGSLALQLGRRAVAGRSYVKVVGEPDVLVVRGELHERGVEMDPKEWRDRTIFPGVTPDADQVTLDDGTTRTVLQRDRRQWTMIEPVRTRVDDVARGELFAALGRAVSGGFILDEPDDLSRFGLAEPAGTVTVVSSHPVPGDGEPRREPRTIRLLVGARMGVGAEDRFGMVEGRPVVVRLPEAVLLAFFRPVVSLVDPTASAVLAANVKTLVIRGPAGEVRLQRDLERWRAPEQGVDVPGQVVAALLEQLTAVRASRIDVGQFPRELQVAAVTMYGFDALPLDTVRIARDPETGHWALDNGDDVLRIFAAEASLPLTPAEFGLTGE
ncbi:MAG: DUF4340 domain-containing protein [Planctomycetota bacterium]|jgi:hypothetical protein